MNSTPRKGNVAWQSPSNIALVKYWGKHGRQLPSNPSISFTLSKAVTKTRINYAFDAVRRDDIKVDFRFHGSENIAFKTKIEKFLNSVKEEFDFLSFLNLEISSENSFPHSSGIASSASSMSALALCLLDIEKELNNAEQIDFVKASHLSRLGSGSASRSVFGPLAVWGKSKSVADSSNEFAIPFTGAYKPIFETFHDDILIVSKAEKSVSSTAGHALMIDNPYAQSRFNQAGGHLTEIITAMETGDLEKFGNIVEKEALTLHALMMASDPPYILMTPATLSIINKIWSFRRNENIPVYFTLDAGPNIHLLYPEAYAEKVQSLIESVKEYCEDGMIISDKVGQGPIRL